MSRFLQLVLDAASGDGADEDFLTTRPVPATTNILQRADPLAAQAQAGNLSLVRAEWNERFLSEFHLFDGIGQGARRHGERRRIGVQHAGPDAQGT
jgi:hypothetical protein